MPIYSRREFDPSEEAKLKKENKTLICWLVDSKARKLEVGYKIAFKGDRNDPWEIMDLSCSQPQKDLPLSHPEPLSEDLS